LGLDLGSDPTFPFLDFRRGDFRNFFDVFFEFLQNFPDLGVPVGVQDLQLPKRVFYGVGVKRVVGFEVKCVDLGVVMKHFTEDWVDF